MKTENTTGENVAIIMLSIVGMFYRGFALMVAWSWLIADRVAARRMTYGEAIAAAILLGFLAARHDLKRGREEPSSVAICLGVNLIAPTLVIVIAAIAKAVL